MTSRTIASVLSNSVLVLVLSQGCALRPALKNSGPTMSADGVQLVVTRQICVETEEPGYYDDNLAEATVEIQIRNGAATPVTVHRDAFRLVTAEPRRAYLKTVTWRAGDPLTITGGASQTFELRFMTRGSLKCASDLTLDPEEGLVMADRAVKVSSISFRPSRGS